MGSMYRHSCDNCGYSFKTSGPWEFYRDGGGQKKPFGHPIPMSAEAAQRGIYGLSANLYCRQCDRAFDLVIAEFKQPQRSGLDVWSGAAEPKDEFKREGAVKCPVCGNRQLLLEGNEAAEPTCPRCKSGRLVSQREWIS